MILIIAAGIGGSCQQERCENAFDAPSLSIYASLPISESSCGECSIVVESMP